MFRGNETDTPLPLYIPFCFNLPLFRWTRHLAFAARAFDLHSKSSATTDHARPGLRQSKLATLDSCCFRSCRATGTRGGGKCGKMDPVAPSNTTGPFSRAVSFPTDNLFSEEGTSQTTDQKLVITQKILTGPKNISGQRAVPDGTPRHFPYKNDSCN